MLQLEVESLEIRARMRNAAPKSPTRAGNSEPTTIEIVETDLVQNVEHLDLSTKCNDILKQVRVCSSLDTRLVFDWVNLILQTYITPLLPGLRKC